MPFFGKVFCPFVNFTKPVVSFGESLTVDVYQQYILKIKQALMVTASAILVGAIRTAFFAALPVAVLDLAVCFKRMFIPQFLKGLLLA